ASRVYFENNRTYCAVLLLLCALCGGVRTPWLLRFQVAILYFGAAFNKLLDSDWRSGHFFVFWYGYIHDPAMWTRITHWVPAQPLGQLMCSTVILIEFALMLGFLVPRMYRWAIWLGIAYHTALLVTMNTTFGMFYYATLASYLSFVDWPLRPGIVLYDGDCGFCDRTRRL